MNLDTFIGRFRVIAILEGISYLLLGVTMPLKYMMEIPEPNYIVGMIHGILFIAYMLLALQAIFTFKWKISTSLIVLAASLIPFGTFYADAKILKPQQIEEDTSI